MELLHNRKLPSPVVVTRQPTNLQSRKIQSKAIASIPDALNPFCGWDSLMPNPERRKPKISVPDANPYTLHPWDQFHNEEGDPNPDG